MELLIIVFRTLFFYFFVSFSYRVMGKREVGQLGIIDLIVSILIAELVAISIENTSDSLALTIVPIIVLVVLELFLAYISLKSCTFRRIIQGKSSVIICDGKINYHELVKQRYTIDDLLINLRQNEIKSIEEVEYAFLESNGKLSVFKYNENKGIYPLPIIMDGKIDKNTLKRTKLSYTKLYELLIDKKIKIDDIFYAFFNKGKIFVVMKNYKNNVLDNKSIGKLQIKH